MQSLSCHYLMRQQVPMVFSLHLVYLSTAACISEKIKLGPCWRKDFLRVKSQAKITKCYFLWVSAINMQSLSGPPFDAPTSTHGVFTSFSLSRCCCLHFCRNKFWFMLAQGYFKGQRSSIIHKLQLFMTLCDMQSSSGKLLDAPSSTHCVVTSFSLSKCCCLHFCRNKFGLLLARGYFKGQR